MVLYWITEFIRRTPILVQLYIVFYVLPDYGIFFEAFTCGVLVLGIHFSTYTSEVFRAGIDNVCLLYTSPSPRDRTRSRMPSSA